MIHVIASIELKDGLRDAFLAQCKENLPKVLAEDGCISYAPGIDLATGFPVQKLNANVVTIVECWKSLEHLKVHLQQPHMKEFSAKTSDMRINTSLTVVEPAC